MPSFTPDDFDVDVDDFLDACSKREIKEIIEALVEDGHLPEFVLKEQKQNKYQSKFEMAFSENLSRLATKYHSISNEDEEKINELFKKYL